MSDNVLVFDYGVGNIGSILNMLKKIGAKFNKEVVFGTHPY